MKKISAIALSLIAFLMKTPLQAVDVIDLESQPQDFIISAKRIEVPGFPGAFNASIIRWKGSLLLCFRVRNAQMISTFEIGFVWLDEDFNPVGTPSLLDIRDENPVCLFQRQDPRLIVIDERLYIIYSNFIKIENLVTRRMFLAEVQQDGTLFHITRPICIHPFEGWSARWEKNWVPFLYNNRLLLAYSLLPHRIFQPSLETGACTTLSSSCSLINWSWGELRGGTPGVRDGNEYLAFFHSSKNVATVNSGGKVITHYVMGAYTFSARPPFEIRRVSPVPIAGKGFYTSQAYATWKPLRVVFPMGCLIEGDRVILAFGKQDFEIWVAELDKKLLYKSLVPCPKTEDTTLAYHDPQINAGQVYTAYANRHGGA